MTLSAALYAGQHLDRSELEQNERTKKLDIEIIAEAEAAYAAHRLAASR